jgi:hypothetical protein
MPPSAALVSIQEEFVQDNEPPELANDFYDVAGDFDCDMPEADFDEPVLMTLFDGQVAVLPTVSAAGPAIAGIDLNGAFNPLALALDRPGAECAPSAPVLTMAAPEMVAA